MIFFDFEVFKYDWLVVAIDMDNQKEHIIVNDRDQLQELYENNIKNIWVGHNIVHYDQYILKSILLGIDPKFVNDKIIVEKIDGWMISKEFNKLPLIMYDTFLASNKGLKTLEGFMGNNIKETDVDFNIDRKLTTEELDMTIKYCRHDVEQDIEVFMRMINEFNAVIGLIKEFPETLSLNDLHRTKAQLSAKILECERPSISRDDQFDVHVLDCISLIKYKDAEQFFTNPENHWYKRGTKKSEFKLIVAGLEHTFGWGGVHAAKTKYHNDGSNCIILHVDVASFYPRLMIFHNLLTRNCKKPEKFKEIYDKRIRLKKEGKKAEQAPLKIVINSTYGQCKDPTSQAYDPRQANMITMNGQLMLVDLIEHLEQINGFELIQSNTDGLIISIPNTDKSFDLVDDICYEWETRCNMELEFDEIDWIYQKDVNNYVCKFSNGEIERKGSYVKELTSLDYDLPIVNKALVDFMVSGVSIEETIHNCNSLMEFQKIVKLTEKYDYVEHNNVRYGYKCYRVFASSDPNDGKILKCRYTTKKIPNEIDGGWTSIDTGEPVISKAKFADTPDNCFIENSNIHSVGVPTKLNKQWYVDLAYKRLSDFGIYTTKGEKK